MSRRHTVKPPEWILREKTIAGFQIFNTLIETFRRKKVKDIVEYESYIFSTALQVQSFSSEHFKKWKLNLRQHT